jgi:hypothetical protein
MQLVEIKINIQTKQFFIFQLKFYTTIYDSVKKKTIEMILFILSIIDV